MAKVIRHERCPKCSEMGRDRRGDNLAVYSGTGGVHCFSCGYHQGGYGIPSPVIEEKLYGSKVLPADFSREVPAHGWQWVLQYGLSWKYWQPYVGWSEKDSRLVFTVGDPIEFSQGRYLGTEDRRKWYVWGNSHESAHVIDTGATSDCIVLVEDLISAHKVGQVTPTIPLFGTKVFNAVIPVLRYYQLPIVMWLDKDQEYGAAKRASHLSSVTNLPVRYVFTEKDPKALSLQDIKEVLNAT